MKKLYFDHEERAKEIGKYFVDHKSTIRSTAKKFGVSKSTVHTDLKFLKNCDIDLYLRVRQLIDQNLAERAYRGGKSTRKKYMIISMLKQNPLLCQLDLSCLVNNNQS
jgi:putative DeoR family transcriptional regulator (stage III sporulation protein D)